MQLFIYLFLISCQRDVKLLLKLLKDFKVFSSRKLVYNGVVGKIKVEMEILASKNVIQGAYIDY